MCKLKEILFSEFGFLTEETLKDLKDLMGGNFKIVARTYEHNRFIVSINEFERLDSDIIDDISDIFIPSDTYNILKSLI